MPVKIAKAARRRLPLVVGAIAVVAALVAGVVVATRPSSSARVAASTQIGITAPKGYTPRYLPAACPARVRSVAPDASCGHLVVPQDRSKPRGKLVRLLVTSAPPRLPGQTVDPTIDVCGCENLGSSLARDHSKLIHVAFRGFFDSDPMLTCPEMTPVRVAALAKPSFDPAEIGRGTDAMRRCHARLVSKGIDPAQYNYDTAAQDLLDLMYALGVHRANFVAFEFADAEVFDVLHRAPAAVRSLTLDNPPPPGITPLSDPIGDLSGAFERYAALCNADPTCAHSYPHLAESWRSA